MTGKVEPNTVGVNMVLPFSSYKGAQGYIGTNRGGDGLFWNTFNYFNVVQFFAAEGLHAAAPILDIDINGTLDSPPAAILSGLPSDLRGTAGTAGYPNRDSTGSPNTVRARMTMSLWLIS